MEIINWIQAHWLEISAAITGLCTLASIIVKLTPNLRDDAAILPVIKFISKWIALNRTVDDNAQRVENEIKDIGKANDPKAS